MQDPTSERYIGWDRRRKRYDKSRRVTIVMGNYVVVIRLTGPKKANFFSKYSIDMPPYDFQCRQCGNCCLNLNDAFQTSVSDKDIELWGKTGRYDILEWVNSISLGNNEYVHDIWISPKTHDDVARCPWLRKLPNYDKYICRIHDVKPKHCREYPETKKHAKETSCRGC